MKSFESNKRQTEQEIHIHSEFHEKLITLFPSTDFQHRSQLIELLHIFSFCQLKFIADIFSGNILFKYTFVLKH